MLGSDKQEFITETFWSSGVGSRLTNDKYTHYGIKFEGDGEQLPYQFRNSAEGLGKMAARLILNQETDWHYIDFQTSASCSGTIKKDNGEIKIFLFDQLSTMESREYLKSLFNSLGEK